eukprot:TRINITY_DN7180_c0_g1_i7.p2 TRINITY_DN7180_c0_g1~~TRINITY_DN7180_c0_g1_i7.p2  ORF type:complete len:143 (+),score=20.96 TRINITY_DN7180_c0_g1_i7:45-473(+)
MQGLTPDKLSPLKNSNEDLTKFKANAFKQERSRSSLTSEEFLKAKASQKITLRPTMKLQALPPILELPPLKLGAGEMCEDLWSPSGRGRSNTCPMLDGGVEKCGLEAVEGKDLGGAELPLKKFKREMGIFRYLECGDKYSGK